MQLIHRTVSASLPRGKLLFYLKGKVYFIHGAWLTLLVVT